MPVITRKRISASMSVGERRSASRCIVRFERSSITITIVITVATRPSPVCASAPTENVHRLADLGGVARIRVLLGVEAVAQHQEHGVGDEDRDRHERVHRVRDQHRQRAEQRGERKGAYARESPSRPGSPSARPGAPGPPARPGRSRRRWATRSAAPPESASLPFGPAASGLQGAGSATVAPCWTPSIRHERVAANGLRLPRARRRRRATASRCSCTASPSSPSRGATSCRCWRSKAGAPGRPTCAATAGRIARRGSTSTRSRS